ncbi:MAG: hypothetical protein AAFX78_19205 [Cyanobacteria bacterium J06638_20]
MATKSPQPTDAPTVQIETTGLLGQPTVQQIQLDSNRLKVKVESLQRFSNAIAIPSRGIWADSLLWVLGIATLVRLPLSVVVAGLAPPYLLALIWGLVALPLAFALGMVFIQVPEQRGDCCYRFCLINAGVAVATRFFFLV